MNLYSLATLCFLVLTIVWAGAIIVMWATRPVANPMLFIRALAAVAVVVICALAGVTTFNQVHEDTPTSRIIFAALGIFAAAVAANQTYRLFNERKFDFRDPAMKRRRGPRR
jgi:hypothetical protein